MTNSEILNTTAHRPWKLPSGKWKFYQEWNKAVFLHWQVEIEELQKLMPKELEIDLYEGKPWVSIVAFNMANIRPRSLPAFAPVSNFAELNIRTYVKYKDKTGVYFLSIEAGNLLACKLAKGISGLPYRFSKMKNEENRFSSSNKEHKDEFLVEYSVGSEITEKDPLDIWLTERYALFQESKKGINTFEIQHLEWSLKNVKINKLRQEYLRFSDLILNSPVRAHYSPGVQVLAWDKNRFFKFKK